SWQLRRLGPEQRTSSLRTSTGDAGNDSFRLGEFQSGRGEVVEEKKRLRASGENVVYRHGNQVDPDTLVPVGREGHFELGTDAIGARNQHWLSITAGDREQPSKPTHAREDLGAMGPGRERFDPLHELIPGLGIYACLVVGDRHARVFYQNPLVCHGRALAGSKCALNPTLRGSSMRV